jgi:hypothetical protein
MAENQHPTSKDLEDRPKTPNIPRPPSKEEVDEISEAQAMITDDWTGEGGKPADQ